jgi:hypothetical protein
LTRYHVIDSLILAALMAMVATCFVQGGSSTGTALMMMFLGSAYLGYKSAFVQLRREAERHKEDS